MPITVAELIEKLQQATNKDAVVVLCVAGYPYADLASWTEDETQTANDDSVIGNYLLTLEHYTDVSLALEN